MTRSSFILLALLVAAGPAVAEVKPRCHESLSYLVVERATGGVGTDLLVKAREIKDPPSCDYTIGHSDFEIKNEDAEYFLALQGDRLILDSGTGPDRRGLIVWDLRSRKKVFSGTYSQPYEIGDGFVRYWMETAQGNERNCQTFSANAALSLGSAIETKVELRLADLSIQKTSETRCAPRQ